MVLKPTPRKQTRLDLEVGESICSSGLWGGDAPPLSHPLELPVERARFSNGTPNEYRFRALGCTSALENAEEKPKRTPIRRLGHAQKP